MEKGQLIEFRLQGERVLAVAERPEGKKDWIVIDGRGQSHKLRPQRVEYTVAGSPYDPTEIPSFFTESQALVDPDNLAVAWEFLVEASNRQPQNPSRNSCFRPKRPSNVMPVI